MNLPYEPKLHAIHSVLAEMPEFPNGWCYYASRMVEQETGLPARAGIYRMPLQRRTLFASLAQFLRPDAPFFGMTHGWNEDVQNHRYVDLTLQQFDPTLPAIAIVSSNDVEFQVDPHLTTARSPYSAPALLQAKMAQVTKGFSDKAAARLHTQLCEKIKQEYDRLKLS